MDYAQAYESGSMTAEETLLRAKQDYKKLVIEHMQVTEKGRQALERGRQALENAERIVYEKWICGECDEIRIDDARVENGMHCGSCAYGGFGAY